MERWLKFYRVAERSGEGKGGMRCGETGQGDGSGTSVC